MSITPVLERYPVAWIFVLMFAASAAFSGLTWASCRKSAPGYAKAMSLWFWATAWGFLAFIGFSSGEIFAIWWLLFALVCGIRANFAMAGQVVAEQRERRRVSRWWRRG